MKRTLFAAIAALLLLAGCTSDIADITLPTAPEPGSIAGAWAGNARWDAVQGGAAAAVTSGSATAIIFQSGAAILGGSTWEVTGLYTGTISGSVDADGNATGTATVQVIGGGCGASASWGGQVNGDRLTITTSFADPGAVPCAGAPVGLTLSLGR